MAGWKLALIFAGIAIALLWQANWLFADARKHSRYPWFWGIWGLVQLPLPLVFYWLIVRLPEHLKNKRDNGNPNTK